MAPSLPASDHARFDDGAESAGRSGAERLHFDIMDLSFGPPVAKGVRPNVMKARFKSRLPLGARFFLHPRHRK